MEPLKPLAQSFAVDDLERDLQALFLQVFDDTLKAQAEIIDVYGMPHVGPFALVERSVAADGLSVLRRGDEDAMRYLFKAWRFRNPRRGTHFLRTYLQALFGSVWEVSQLWQKKTGVYPVEAYSEAEIAALGESLGDYFLTSRLRVDVDTDIIPERVLRSLKSTVAARFVLGVRLARRSSMPLVCATVSRGVTAMRAIGQTVFNPLSALTVINEVALVVGD